MPTIQEVLASKRKKIDERKARSQSMDLVTPLEGTHTYRFLPPWKNDGRIFQEFGQHWITNPDPNKKNLPILCMRKSYDDDHECPACNALLEVITDTNRSQEEVDEFKKMFATQKYIANVLILSGKEPHKVVRLVVGQKVYDQIENIILGGLEEDENYDITNPDKGWDLKITRSGSGFDTSYSVVPKIAPSAIPKEARAVLKELPQLDEEVALERDKDYSTQMKMLGQLAGETSAPALNGGGGWRGASIEDLRGEAEDAAFTSAESEYDPTTEIPWDDSDSASETEISDSEIDELDDLLS